MGFGFGFRFGLGGSGGASAPLPTVDAFAAAELSDETVECTATLSADAEQWTVTESAAQPTHDETWTLAGQPRMHTTALSGAITLYAWAWSEAGGVSLVGVPWNLVVIPGMTPVALEYGANAFETWPHGFLVGTVYANTTDVTDPEGTYTAEKVAAGVSAGQYGFCTNAGTGLEGIMVRVHADAGYARIRSASATYNRLNTYTGQVTHGSGSLPGGAIRSSKDPDWWLFWTAGLTGDVAHIGICTTEVADNFPTNGTEVIYLYQCDGFLA